MVSETCPVKLNVNLCVHDWKNQNRKKKKKKNLYNKRSHVEEEKMALKNNVDISGHDYGTESINDECTTIL